MSSPDAPFHLALLGLNGGATDETIVRGSVSVVGLRLDLTDELIRKYNARHPAGGGGAKKHDAKAAAPAAGPKK